MTTESGAVPAPYVLLVEDQDDALEMLADVIAAAGYRVVLARNGIDAVDTAVKLLPDVVVMDLSLPIMGGCEATRLLKSDDRTREIPIIALTGHHNFMEMARQAGCDAFLTKPCPPDRLIEEIRSFVGEAGEAAPRAPAARSN